jgi:hypothetical protein
MSRRKGTSLRLSRAQEDLSLTTKALLDVENQLDLAHFKVDRTKATLDRTKETLAQTQQALAATQAALTLALEACNDAQAFQMNGFY